MRGGGETTLDARGRRCPQPIVDLARELAQMEPGAELVVLSDDLAFPLDLRAWCAGTGHELLDLVGDGRVHRARVRRRGPD